MKQVAGTLVIGAVALLWGALPVLAGSYTVNLQNGYSFETKYPPRFGEQDVQLLTEVGNWISLPRDLVTSVADSTSASGYGRVIDTKTVFIGWAPNDAPSGLLEEEPVDSLSILLSYLESPDWSRQDFSVPQFVNTEDIVGGFPAQSVYQFSAVDQDPLLETYQGLPPGGLRALQGLP